MRLLEAKISRRLALGSKGAPNDAYPSLNPDAGGLRQGVVTGSVDARCASAFSVAQWPTKARLIPPWATGGKATRCTHVEQHVIAGDRMHQVRRCHARLVARDDAHSAEVQ